MKRSIPSAQESNVMRESLPDPVYTNFFVCMIKSIRMLIAADSC